MKPNHHYTANATIAFPGTRHRVRVCDLRPGMFVRIHCEDDACKHIAEIPADEFQRGRDPEAMIVSLAPKFRCQACGRLGTRFWDVWQ